MSRTCQGGQTLEETGIQWRRCKSSSSRLPKVSLDVSALLLWILIYFQVAKRHLALCSLKSKPKFKTSIRRGKLMMFGLRMYYVIGLLSLN